MSDQTAPKVLISASQSSVQLKPDGTLEIKDSILAEIVKSGVAATSTAASGGITPMISITIT